MGLGNKAYQNEQGEISELSYQALLEKVNALAAVLKKDYTDKGKKIRLFRN